MSGLEIERKFLVRKDRDWKSRVVASHHIRQGYIPCLNATVRIRLRDDEAFLTIKGRPAKGGFARYEFEKEITIGEADHLLALCEGGMIDKVRHLIPSGRHTWEVDEFFGDNEGLVMAEIELAAEDEPFERPDFIGLEVTDDHRYYNKYLLTHPFTKWRE